MKQKLSNKLFLPVVLVLISALIFCCISLSRSGTNVSAAEKQPTTVPAANDDSDLLSQKLYSATHSRSRWLYDLLRVSGLSPELENTPEAILAEAAAHDIIDSDDAKTLYAPLDRRFVAQSTVKALHYPQRSPGYLADVTEDDGAMATMAYFGYFLPDINYMTHPEAAISAEEYDALLEELYRYSRLKGKKLLSFGDSIMYGAGNAGEGISDMIAEKYGMVCADYSVPGAAMGMPPDRTHIADQLRRAAAAKETADIILLNGGTNDVNHTPFIGSMTDGFYMKKAEEESYIGGFEKTLWLLKTSWKNTPVIYIRAHNMNIANDKKEELYGDKALEITEKWGVTSVDLYHRSGMNAEDPLICSRYTMISPRKASTCDSIHPTAIGYAKFYLPPITEKIVEQIK